MRKNYVRTSLLFLAIVSLFALSGCEGTEPSVPTNSGTQINKLSTIAGNPLIIGLAAIQNGVEIANLENSAQTLNPDAGSISIETDYQDPELVESEQTFIEGTSEPAGGKVVRKIVAPEFFYQVFLSTPYIRFGIITTFKNGDVQEATTANWMKVTTIFLDSVDKRGRAVDEDVLVEGEAP